VEEVVSGLVSGWRKRPVVVDYRPDWGNSIALRASTSVLLDIMMY